MPPHVNFDKTGLGFEKLYRLRRGEVEVDGRRVAESPGRALGPGFPQAPGC